MKIVEQNDQKLVATYGVGWIYTVFGILGLIITVAGVVGVQVMSKSQSDISFNRTTVVTLLVLALVSVILLLIHPSQKLVIDRQSGFITVKRQILWIGVVLRNSMAITNASRIEAIAFVPQGPVVAASTVGAHNIWLPKAPIVIVGTDGKRLNFGNVSDIKVNGLKEDPAKMPELRIASQIATYLNVPFSSKQRIQHLLRDEIADLPLNIDKSES